MSDQPRPSTRVSLEDLLRLKRAERPPAEFWMDFERSLRAKQLAAIVDKRPWWRTWPNLSLSRWSIPLGAAAALTLTVTVVSHSQRKGQPNVAKAESAPVAVQSAPSSSVPVVVAATAIQSTVLPQSTTVQEVPAPIEAPAQAVALAATEAPSAPARLEQPAPAAPVEVATSAPIHLASVSEQIAGLGLGEGEQSSPARFTAVAHRDSAAVRELNNFFERAVARLDPGIRSEKTQAIEPLAQIQSPRDARRARLLAFSGAVDTHSPQYSDASNVIRSRDRIASHLSEEALYDSIRRLGLKNGGVSIQF